MSFFGVLGGGKKGGAEDLGVGLYPKINGVSSPLPPDFGGHAGPAEGDQRAGGETGADVQRHR